MAVESKRIPNTFDFPEGVEERLGPLEEVAGISHAEKAADLFPEAVQELFDPRVVFPIMVRLWSLTSALRIRLNSKGPYVPPARATVTPV